MVSIIIYHVGKLTSLLENKHELADTLYLIILQGVNKLLPIIVLPYLLLHLGAAGYGRVMFAFAAVMYCCIVVEFGFDLSATREVAQKRDDVRALNRTFWAVVWARTLLLFATVPLLLFIVLLVPAFRPYMPAVVVMLPMAVGTAYTLMWMYQGIGRVREMAVINSLSKFLLLPLIFFFVHTEADYLMAALLLSSVFLLTAVVSCCWLYWRYPVGRPQWRWADVRRVFVESVPLFLSRASTSVYTQLFVLILGLYCTQEDVGRYTSAEQVMRALCFLLYVPLTQAFFPRISRLATTDRPAALRAMRQVQWLVVVAMLVVGAMLFFGAPFAPHYLGADYEGLDALLRLLAPAPLFIGLGAVYGQMGLVALGNARAHRQFLYVYMAVALLSLVLVFAFVPWQGAMGAAWALLISEGLVCVLMFACYQYNTRLSRSS